ncbi:MAG: class I SAM-dependent methyltransferase [Deltaproteobacteria bacterium]|nr:class I SAM-dependent methyltransferase [Deltaproteobacteria bacterium]
MRSTRGFRPQAAGRRARAAPIVLLALLAAGCAAAAAPTAAPTAAPRAERRALDWKTIIPPGPPMEQVQGTDITIRNISTHAVAYSVEPADGTGASRRHVLEPGAIDRFPAPGDVHIGFESKKGTQGYRLVPGASYLFRYEERDGASLNEGSHGRADAADLGPFVPTPPEVVEKMLEAAELTDKDVFFDLGCGDGRIVIAAAQRYGCRGVGIDLDPKLVEESRRNAERAGVARLVEFRAGDATKADLTGATAVTLYLLPESNEALRPLLEKQLAPGARIVCHDYGIRGWEGRETRSITLVAGDGKKHYIYVYRR